MEWRSRCGESSDQKMMSLQWTLVAFLCLLTNFIQLFFFLFFSKEESAQEEENGGVKEAIRGVLLKMSLLQCTHQSNPEGELIKLRLRISLKFFCHPIRSYFFVMKYNQFRINILFF